MLRSISISTLLLSLGLFVTSVARATDYDEAVNGDLSGDRLNPTAIAPLTVGSNNITATSASGDIEYYKVTIPAGKRLSAIVVVSNTSSSLSFIAVQQGTQFTQPPSGTDVSKLLGYSHFGVGNSTIGTDILDNIGTGSGAIGFTPPLRAGDYTFWSQETSSTPSTYHLDFQVTNVPSVPIPMGAIAALMLGLLLLGAWRVGKLAA